MRRVAVLGLLVLGVGGCELAYLPDCTRECAQSVILFEDGF